MDEAPAPQHAELCAAIGAAIQIAEAANNTLVSALLVEAHDAATCVESVQ